MFFPPTPIVDNEPINDQSIYEIRLTQEQTVKVREACRAQGVTVTQFMTAIILVAEVECALRKFVQQKDKSDADRKQAVHAYENAEHIMTGWNIVSHVSSF